MIMSSFKLTASYVLALSLIALFSIGSHFALIEVIAAQDGAAEIINVSGRQRMLSQRIARFALQYTAATDTAARATARENLTAAVDLMADSHRRLVNAGGDSNLSDIAFRQSEAVEAIYVAEPHELDTRVREYLQHARDLLAAPLPLSLDNVHLAAILEASQRPLLASLDFVVRQYEAEAREQVEQLEYYQLIGLGVLLGILLLEVLIIFRPMIVRITRQAQSLVKANLDFLSLVDNVQIPVVILDRNLSIRQVNQFACELFGYSSDELIGRSIDHLVPEGEAVLRRVVARSEFDGIHELQVFHKDHTRERFAMDFQVGEYGTGLLALLGRIPDRRAAA
ncbi:MAG: type IV pili methyl-accepting chemotaxis transducer N-terminal domain-containing protein [Candidatus Competibacterales bacterium]